MSKEDLDMTNEELLESLGLITNGKLKRAAVMLFYRKPERIISGCYIKVGKFGEGADLQYQDEIKGSLILIADRVIELIYLKYLKAAISYQKETRVETYPFPRDAIREAVYNALIHCHYADSIPIQIRIEDEVMYITNSCILPSDWTVNNLMEQHKSRPYNPDVANTFFRAGYVETWGRGIKKICEACEEYGTEPPQYTVIGDDITVKFIAHEQSKISKYHNDTLDDTLDDTLENKILVMIEQNSLVTQSLMSEMLNVSIPTVKRYIKKLADEKIIEREGGKRYGRWIIIK